MVRYLVGGTVSCVSGWGRYKGHSYASRQANDKPAQLVILDNGNTEVYREGELVDTFTPAKKHFSHNGMKEVTRATFLRHVQKAKEASNQREEARKRRNWRDNIATLPAAFISEKIEGARDLDKRTARAVARHHDAALSEAARAKIAPLVDYAALTAEEIAEAEREEAYLAWEKHPDRKAERVGREINLAIAMGATLEEVMERFDLATNERPRFVKRQSWDSITQKEDANV